MSRRQAQTLVEGALRSDPSINADLLIELTNYLAYVNANLVLSSAFNAGFHDWEDFRPFYHDKFLPIGKRGAPSETEVRALKQLFEVSFPEFGSWSQKNVIRALKDKRIRDLRALAEAAAAGEVRFDREFAVRTLREVLDVERSIDRVKNVASYVTMPLGFIPLFGTPVQKAVDEAAGKVIASKLKSRHRWFYLISERGTAA